MIFAEAYPVLRELHEINTAAAQPGADVAGLAQRLEPLAARIGQPSDPADCAVLWWPATYSGYFAEGVDSITMLRALLASARGPVVWVREVEKLAALPEQARAFVGDTMRALSTAGRVIVLAREEAGLAGGICAGVVTGNPPLADAFRAWGRSALAGADDVASFVASLVAPDLAAEVATALAATARGLEAAFQREVLGVG